MYGRNKEEEKVITKGQRKGEKEEIEFPKIMEWEVEDKTKTLKIGKAPGPDRIENKILTEILKNPLTEIFNQILKEDKTPKQWETEEIILLHRKGKISYIENYHRISLTSSICKVFIKILKNRVYKQLDLNQLEEQAGFRKKYSTIYHIHTLNQVIEKAKEYKIDLYLMFVDYWKVFDSVSHAKI